MIVAVVVNLYFLRKLQNYTMSGKEECVRCIKQVYRKLDSNSTEAFSGLTVIRAYEKQNEFIENLTECYNKKTLC